MASDSIPQTKKCNRCGIEKPVDEFNRNKSGRLGRASKCRLCYRTYFHELGMRSRTPEYRSWSSAKDRCENQRCPGFKNYGGRGISMCERWSNSFEAFKEDMGDRPPRTSLDRIDVNGNYEPCNCRWATTRVQGNNKRNTLTVTVNGVDIPVAEWARETGINIAVYQQRLSAGWSKDRAAAPLTRQYRRRPFNISDIARQTGLTNTAIEHRIARGATLEDLMSKPPLKRPVYLFHGNEMFLPDIAKIVGINYNTLRGRLRNGFSLERATSERVQKRTHRVSLGQN